MNANHESESRRRGRPPKPPEERKQRRKHSGGRHKPAAEDICARLDVLVARMTADLPADAPGSRRAVTERRLGLMPSAVTAVYSGKIRAAVVDEWEVLADEYWAGA